MLKKVKQRGAGITKESDDELPQSKKKKDEVEESEEEESGDLEEADDVSTSSEIEIKKPEAEAELKDGNAELNALERDKQAINARIQAAKQHNVAKLSELKQTLDAYPAIASTLICTF